MKKFFKAAIATAMVCFSASLFAAAPSSFLKGTTYDLFEDEVVDNFAWGLEDITGLVLGGYDNTNYNFKVGAGAWLGPLWWSVYETGTFSAQTTKTESVKNNVVANDGVNTDYVNVTKDTKTEGNQDNSLKNELYVSFGNGDWGLQTYWKLNDYSDLLYTYIDNNGDTRYRQKVIGKHSEYSEDKSTGVITTKETNRNIHAADNYFGVNFKGIGASEIGDVNLFFNLTNFEVKWYNWADNMKGTESFTKNGASVTGSGTGFFNGNYTSNIEQKDYNGTSYNTMDYKRVSTNNWFTPKVSAEMGFSLPELGSLATTFVLGDDFDCTLAFSKYERTVTYITEDTNEKVTKKETSKNNKKMDFSWNNTFKPKFVFDFEVTERLAVKASASADVIISGSTLNNPYTGSWISETTTYNKINKTTIKNYTNNENLWNSGQLQKEFETIVTPNTALAFVYQVKPEKFNVNLGVQWYPGTFKWTTTTKINKPVTTSSYSETINAAGTKTVTTDEKSVVNQGDTATGDATAETRTTVFTASNASAPELNIGATWFIADNVTLDMASIWSVTPGNVSIWNSIVTKTIKLMFTVKF